ncbi:MAG TPA: cupin domain-containing protein [Mycobacterium sp.]
MSTLAWLLAPLGVEDFFADVWGAADHHVRRHDPGYFEARLPGLSTADGLLEHVRPEPSAVRSVRGYEHRDFGVYRLADGSLDLAGVRNDLADGYTIVLDSLERYARRVTSLSHGLEVELNFPVQVNAYLTPPGSTGFLPHYDHHDVLILQLQGSKNWHLYGDAVPPHQMQRQRENDPHGLPSPTGPPTDVRLRAGDTLYLPRGRIHAAETAAEPSIHLTVGVHVPTVLTLLTHTVHLLSLGDDRVHARLPPRHLDDPGVRAGLGELLHDVLTAVEEPGSVAAGLDAMADLLVRRGRCPPVRQTDRVATGIDGHTRVAKHQPLYSRVTTAPDRVTLHFAQLVVNAAPEHQAAMRFVSGSTAPFRVCDLPGLDGTRQIELARSLIASGFLVRRPGDESADA